jgi:hypothetical protein
MRKVVIIWFSVGKLSAVVFLSVTDSQNQLALQVDYI